MDDKWNFETYAIYIDRRFTDLELQLRERLEAQKIALAAAEKTVIIAMSAAEKAIDKSERAQDLRNQAANEFRSSLSDLSGLMWTSKEGTAALDALRRERELAHQESITRIALLETGFANIQGRIWAVSALFAIVALMVSVGVRFIGH